MRVMSPREGSGVGTTFHGLQRTGSVSSTGSRVLAKQTHSARGLRDDADDDDEGRIVSDSSMSTEFSSESSVESPFGSPAASLSWRNYLVVRGWLPDVSFEDVLPAVALTMGLGALVCAVVVLGRQSASRGGH
ncbi:hypothetical protein MTO96_020479 [Rhipicephalus appendiculatus]